MTVVGFIGLGNMGAHMAKNLMKNGVKLIVNDVVAPATYEFKLNGAAVAETPAEVAAQADTLFTMLPSSPEVNQVYLGKNGIRSAAKPDTLCIDCSTIDPAVSKFIHRAMAEDKSHYIDSPVSGGVVAARDANLTFMVGGSEHLYDRAQPLIRHMGKNIVHCGAVGNGQVAKLCNNLLLAISMIGVSESMSLGQSLGIDPTLLAKIINSSSGRCWSSELYNPVPGVVPGVPSSRDYDGGFATALMAKDLGLAQDAAAASQTPIPFGALASQVYRIMSKHPEFATKDFSVVIKYLQGK